MIPYNPAFSFTGSIAQESGFTLVAEITFFPPFQSVTLDLTQILTLKLKTDNVVTEKRLSEGTPKKKITTLINFWNVLKCVTDGV